MTTEQHTVLAGETLPQLVHRLDVSAGVLLEHNPDLVQDGEVHLEEGQVVTVPAEEPSYHEAHTGRRNAYELVGRAALLRVALMNDWGFSYADRPYELSVDDVVVARGRTGHDGLLEALVPPQGRRARLRVVVEPATAGQTVVTERVWTLDLKHFAGRRTLEGRQQRLQNLGLFDGTVGQDSPETVAAQKRFQLHVHDEQKGSTLPTDGTCDDPTLDAMRRAVRSS